MLRIHAENTALQIMMGIMKKGPRLARTTGLEPATTGSTGRDSNQLSYVPYQSRPLRSPTDFGR